METREAFQLLTLASARDGRTVDVELAAVWADDLRDVTLAEATQAARDHYRESTAWLMPAHVLQRVAARRAAADDWWHRWRDYGWSDDAFYQLAGEHGPREAMRMIEAREVTA